jgi:hypothetical protein
MHSELGVQNGSELIRVVKADTSGQPPSQRDLGPSSQGQTKQITRVVAPLEMQGVCSAQLGSWGL